MTNTCTITVAGNYRCTATPLDGRGPIALLAIGPDGTTVTIGAWSGTNPLCVPRGGTVEIFDVAVGTVLKIDRPDAELVVTRMP